MYANSYSGHFSFTSSDLAYVESILLKTQARIYQAAQVCADNTVCKEYDITVCRKDIILLIARNAIQLIKKKSS